MTHIKRKSIECFSENLTISMPSNIKKPNQNTEKYELKILFLIIVSKPTANVLLP